MQSPEQKAPMPHFIADMDSCGSEWIPHIEEGFDLELPFLQAMVAGGVAGVSEHVCMFPVDTIKTRLQAVHTPQAPIYTGITDALKRISRSEGIGRLYRGVTAIVLAAVPSHALYFATYEKCKEAFGGNNIEYNPGAHGLAGAIATMAHDAVVTPLDVVKQRLQIYNSEYSSTWHCMRTIAREEGARAFYRSYPTTVAMNVPFMTIHFAVYESAKRMLSNRMGGEKGALNAIVAGGLAGASGGLVSTPLDVIKTRIQTQHLPAEWNFAKAFVEVAKKLWREEGYKGFTHGASARVLYFAPSAAICWTTYETLKRTFLVDHHDHDHDHHHDHHHDHDDHEH